MTISLAPRAYGSCASISLPADFLSGLTKGPEKQEQQQSADPLCSVVVAGCFQRYSRKGQLFGLCSTLLGA